MHRAKLSFRKTAFDEVGGFGGEYSKQSADDVLLLHLINRSKKWKIAFADDPNSYVETDASQSLIGFLKRRIRWSAMGVGQFSKSKNLTTISISTAVVNIGLFLLLSLFWLLPANLIQFLIIALIIKFVLDFYISINRINIFQES